MELALMVDFGSTFTKVTAVDLESERVIGRAEAPTAVDTDIMTGLNEALDKLRQNTGVKPSAYKRRLACSSAAGGLRMVAIGLAYEKTLEAASQVDSAKAFRIALGSLKST